METGSMRMSDFIAPHVRNIAASGIRKFFELEAGSDTISLGVGEPDFVTPAHVREACIRALGEGKTMYTPNAGLMELREEIAGYLHSGFNLQFEPQSEVLVTVGSSEAVDLALRTLISAGDEILLCTPSYIAYSPVASLQGGVIVEVETSAEEQFKLTAQALQGKITPRSKVLIVNFPNNPTGAVMTREDWLPIARLAAAHNLIVISDEIYAELAYDGRHCSLASLPGMKDRTIVIGGFSKAFAMTGWRVGYVCGNRELIAAMLKIHQYTAMCAPVLGQIAAIESLRSGLEEKDRMIRSFKERRDLFIQGLRAIGLPCHEPPGAFYAFPSIRHTGLTSEQFALRLLKEAGVAAVAGSVFGAGGEGFIRCSYSVSQLKLDAALERMERFLRTLAPAAAERAV
ncbi:aminotransferase class I/II-fold pyridoxal phosphate-dependent enzyme [Paenibacillus nasutitermitis]|uniref:Aminotransferase n=1 Tax=Paenibacillus nasutitermitis TaxID=1652958 RepID=A0A916ZDS3_9BACL|nr:aminotransferase class I/II-fold pyridoxal phosphate-dependent enzyme [Paenibacillus nasutitermitis]GGD89147.1 aminotransferase [Paenibacillus nasutitermitis]